MAPLPTSPIRSHRTARGSDSTRCTATRVTLSEEMCTLVGMTAIKRELQRASLRRVRQPLAALMPQEPRLWFAPGACPLGQV